MEKAVIGLDLEAWLGCHCVMRTADGLRGGSCWRRVGEGREARGGREKGAGHKWRSSGREAAKAVSEPRAGQAASPKNGRAQVTVDS